MQPLWKTVWKFLKKLKIELQYDPTIPLLGIYPRKTKTLIQKDTCTPMFIALFTTAKIWKQPKCPSTDEGIKRIYIHTYTMEYYSDRKKNEILPFATTQMDLEGTMLSEMTDRERQILYDITYVWNLTNKRNE